MYFDLDTLIVLGTLYYSDYGIEQYYLMYIVLHHGTTMYGGYLEDRLIRHPCRGSWRSSTRQAKDGSQRPSPEDCPSWRALTGLIILLLTAYIEHISIRTSTISPLASCLLPLTLRETCYTKSVHTKGVAVYFRYLLPLKCHVGTCTVGAADS